MPTAREGRRYKSGRVGLSAYLPGDTRWIFRGGSTADGNSPADYSCRRRGPVSASRTWNLRYPPLPQITAWKWKRATRTMGVSRNGTSRKSRQRDDAKRLLFSWQQCRLRAKVARSAAASACLWNGVRSRAVRARFLPGCHAPLPGGTTARCEGARTPDAAS